MLCTVVIPWHRNLDDLRRAVASVFAQTHQQFEIVVVVNGADSATYDAAAALFNDKRYRTDRLEVANASAARNHGLALARGELVFFLDADDFFYPQKLARFVDAHRETGFDVAFSRGRRQRGNGVSWPFPIGHWDGGKPVSEFFFCDGCTISTSAIVIAGSQKARLRFDESCGSYEDPDLIMRAEAMGMHVRMLPDALYQWSDERIGDRLSQQLNYEVRLAWIDHLGTAATPRARAAFRARCVGQHTFPRDFRRNMGFFRDALVLGAVPSREILMFMLRGLLPAGAQRRLLNVYVRAREKSFDLSHPERT